MDETGIPAVETPILPQKTVVREIQRAIRYGYRRLLVVGPTRSKRLESVRKAFAQFRTRIAVIDLSRVHSRKGLDMAVQRATGSKDFYGGMRKLLRQAQRRRVAIVFHNIDGCCGSLGEEYVVYRVWMEARHHCGSTHTVFTARDPDFVVRCLERYEQGRGLVCPINLAYYGPEGVPANKATQGGMP